MTASGEPLRVGVLPYAPSANPYQSLFANSLEDAGMIVERIGDRRLFPINRALRRPIDVLRLDWPDTFYIGRNRVASVLKRGMYHAGLWELRRFPVVWTVHNLVSHGGGAGETRVIQRLIDRCDGLVAMSRAAEALLRARYQIPSACRVAVIPHGHYVDAYENSVSKSRARAELGLPSSARVVLFLGKLRPYKGVDELINAFETVATSRDVLVVAGRPVASNLEAELAELARAARQRGVQVRLVPRSIPASQLQVYFNAADLVALPFKNILNSGSLLLAMSFAKCVVAPALGSLPEIAHPDSLFSYQPGPGALAAALGRALDASDLEARGLAARDFAVAQYDWRSVGEANLRLCAEVTQRSGARRR